MNKIVQAIEYLISVGPICRHSMPSLLAGVGQLSQLAKLCLATGNARSPTVDRTQTYVMI